MTSPLHLLIALSKFLVEPRFSKFTKTPTGKEAHAANISRICTVVSVEQSSQITSSSGRQLCAAILRNCSGKYAAPLQVHSAIKIMLLGVTATPE